MKSKILIFGLVCMFLLNAGTLFQKPEISGGIAYAQSQEEMSPEEFRARTIEMLKEAVAEMTPEQKAELKVNLKKQAAEYGGEFSAEMERVIKEIGL